MSRPWRWHTILSVATVALLALAHGTNAQEADSQHAEFNAWDELGVEYQMAAYRKSDKRRFGKSRTGPSCDAPVGGECNGACGGSCNGGCDSLSQACNVATRCGSSWLWNVEAEAVFLRPNLTDSPITFTLNDLTPASNAVLTSGGADIEDVTVAPRITIGIHKEGTWGLRGRVFRLEAAASGFDPIAGVGDVGGNSFSSLDMYTTDLELTKDACLGSWSLLGSLGVRHAAIERDESLAAAGVVDLGGGFVDVIAGNGLGSRSFHGTGLTAALQGTRKAHCRGFSWFWNARGSVLWGDNNTFNSTSAILSGAFGSANSFNQAFNTESDTLFIGEAQLGLEWSHELACVPGRAFARAAVEGQYWEANEGASFSTSAVGTGFESLGTVFAGQRELELDMFGAALAAGIEF
jgi:hypothetical protein